MEEWMQEEWEADSGWRRTDSAEVRVRLIPSGGDREKGWAD